MLDLQPLIARLVDDLLRLIRGASVEELNELYGAPLEDPPRRQRRARQSGPRSAPKRPAAPARKKAPRRTEVVASVPAPEPALHAEITDPERLLAVATPPAPTKVSAGPHAPAEEPSPPSGERRAVGASVALRRGESVARASEHGGVVIRRKRA
jgi:hypothetical protein